MVEQAPYSPRWGTPVFRRVNVIETYENHQLFYNDRWIYFTKVNTTRGGSVGKTDSAIILNKRDVEGKMPVEIHEIVFSSTMQNIEIGDVIG